MKLEWYLPLLESFCEGQTQHGSIDDLLKDIKVTKQTFQKQATKLGYSKQTCVISNKGLYYVRTPAVWKPIYSRYNPGSESLPQIAESLNISEGTLRTTFKQLGFQLLSASESRKRAQSKIESTTLNKYGVSNVSQAKGVKLKKLKTNMKNNGVMYPYQNKFIMGKALTTLNKKQTDPP